MANTQPANRTNALGMIGFCMVVGTTLLSPTGFLGVTLCLLVPLGFTGLALCAVSLAKKPRWMGVTGLAIGLTCIAAWAALFAVPFFSLSSTTRAMGMNLGQYAQTSMSAMALAEAAEAQRLPSGQPPTAFSFAMVDPAYATDVWGRPFRYTLVGTPRGFTFFSDGPDRTPGTTDDIDLFTIQSGGMFPLPP